MNNKLELFETELDYIKNTKIRKFAEKALLMLPEYFWKMPAATSKKYHPPFSLGEGGVIRHTKVAVRIAVDILSLEMMRKYTDDDKDIIICSLILHDGTKKGIPGGPHSIVKHPLVMAEFIENTPELIEILDKEILDKIVGCIRTHMGEFNKDYRSRKEVLPKPKTGMQNIVHLADYLSSRRYFKEFDFDIKIERDRKY